MKVLGYFFIRTGEYLPSRTYEEPQHCWDAIGCSNSATTYVIKQDSHGNTQVFAYL